MRAVARLRPMPCSATPPTSYMLTGERPSGLATKAFDVALILHADHELNASTFAARVIAATLSDIHSGWSVASVH